jgi:beta-barrel assembly-enhancing protease
MKPGSTSGSVYSPGDGSAARGLWLVAGLAVLIPLSLYGLYRWGLPAVGGLVARLVPASVERKLGASMADSLAPKSAVCESGSLDQVIASIRRRLDVPESVEIRVSQSPVVNAFAAPGGFLILNRGLIERMQTPEQLAAVIAHEMQHVSERHSMKAIGRAAALQVTVALLLGDVSSVAAMMAGELTALSYQRGDEAAADLNAAETLRQAGISPLAMSAALNNLSGPDVPKYLSSHPDTGERIEAIEQQFGQAPVKAEPVAAAGVWERARMSCQPRPQ